MDKDDLIKKWLDNSLTTAEKDSFDAMEDSAYLKEIIEEGKRFKGQNPTKVISFEALDIKLNEKSPAKLNWGKLALKIAAIFIIGFGLYTLFYKGQQNTFETQLAQTEQITLPDNSMVTLNESSQLDFNSNNWDKERSVNLKGEAYFKVAKGKRFDVKTKLGTISVLGTQFNVSIRDGLLSVVCYEGLVQVTQNEITTKLPAGTAYNNSNGTSKIYSVAVKQPEWLLNMKVFEKASIKDVFTAIENHYNIKIDASEIDSSILFTGAFELDNLENALKETTQSLNLRYEMINKNEVIIRNAKK